MLSAWHALAESGPKTALHINDLKSSLSKRYTELLQKKDEILSQYREGISSLKRIELHKSLCKDASGLQKEHLIDIYYNEKSMDQFKNSCQS